MTTNEASIQRLSPQVFVSGLHIGAFMLERKKNQHF